MEPSAPLLPQMFPAQDGMPSIGSTEAAIFGSLGVTTLPLMEQYKSISTISGSISLEECNEPCLIMHSAPTAQAARPSRLAIKEIGDSSHPISNGREFR